MLIRLKNSGSAHNIFTPSSIKCLKYGLNKKVVQSSPHSHAQYCFRKNALGKPGKQIVRADKQTIWNHFIEPAVKMLCAEPVFFNPISMLVPLVF